MINIIILFFFLGFFQNSFIKLFNNFISFIFKNNISLQKSINHYLIIILNILFKVYQFIIIIFIIYSLYLTIKYYNNFDLTYLKNINILSFDDFENLSKTVNDPNLNNTNININSFNIEKILDNFDFKGGLSAAGAYKVGMEASKHVNNIGAKILVGGIAAGYTATAVSLGLKVGEDLSK